MRCTLLGVATRLVGVGCFLLLLHHGAAAQAPISAQDVYIMAPAASGARRGVTKNVAVELYSAGGQLHRRITALDANQFAVRPATTDTQTAFRDQAGALFDLVVPVFLRGDNGIRITVNPTVGFTEFVGLKLLDPAVLSIAADGVVEADIAGVRAIRHAGTVTHSRCFLSVSRSVDAEGRESFDVGAFMNARQAPDGSMLRKAGEMLDCPVELAGADGPRYVSRRVTLADRSAIVFVRGDKD
jgi:hypothetical protein